MERFFKDNKLQVQSDEIDNIYIWTRVTKTQEVLLSAKTYYEWAQSSFNQEAQRIIPIIKSKLPSLDEKSYRFSDFITFMANKHKLFNDNTCFVYSTNYKLIESLACFIAHTRHNYLPDVESLPGLIINRIDEPEKFSRLLDKDFILLNVYSTMPEHKWRSIILDTLLSRRSNQNLYTLIYVLNKSLLIDKTLITEEQAKRHKLLDISPMTELFLSRRTMSYKELMPLWLEMLEVNLDNFVYSKTKPLQSFRKIDRYQK